MPLRTFTVYPKKGEAFTIKCEHFEVKDSKFILFNDSYEASSEGFLSFDRVAAIMPERQDDKYAICFDVYLKDRQSPLQVFAHAFDIETGPSILFCRQDKDIRGKVMHTDPIETVYIAVSEVVAIMPADGLHKFRAW